MSESANQELTTSRSPRTHALIAELESRHEAWRKEVRELARLHQEARDIAQREAEEILTRARDEVCRIIVDARRQISAVSGNMQTVQHLRAEIDGVSKTVGRVDGPGFAAREDADTPPDSVLRARRELRHMMAEAGPDLKTLASEVLQFTSTLDSMPAPSHD